MGNGFRTLNIESLNPDSFKMQQEIINELTRRKIHIATIQETRISDNLNYKKTTIESPHHRQIRTKRRK